MLSQNYSIFIVDFNRNIFQLEFVGKLKGELPGLDEGETIGDSSDEERETNTT